MQWDDSQFAGFSDNSPWLPVHKNKEWANVMAQSSHDNSLLSMHRRLLHLRSQLPVLRFGSFEPLDVCSGYVLAFKRELDGARAYVVVNYADSPQRISLPEQARVVASTSRLVSFEQKTTGIDLGAHEALLLMV